MLGDSRRRGTTALFHYRSERDLIYDHQLEHHGGQQANTSGARYLLLLANKTHQGRG